MTTAVRYAVLGSLFLIPFIPLYVSNSLFFPFITGKAFAFRILVELALVGWGLLMLVDPKYRPRFSWTLVLYGALVAWMFVANLFAVNPEKAFWSNYERMDGWVTLVHVFAFFLIAGSVFKADKLWRKWWLTFLGASTFVGLYGLLQVMGIFTIHQGGVRLDATLGNAAYLAVYLLFVIAVAVWQAFESKGWMRYALFALAGLQVFLLFLTATRGAILGFVVGAVIGVALWLISSKGKARRYGIGIAAALLVLIAGFFFIRDTSFVREDPTLSRLASISLADGSTRFTLWDMAAKGVAERPITGWGQEGFNYIFNEHYTPSLFMQEPWFDRAHSVYVDWLTAGGIPALVLFVSLLGMGVFAIYRNGGRYERIFLISGIGAYAFQALFVFDNLFSYVPLAALLAVAHGLSSRPIAKLEEAPQMELHIFQNVAAPIGLVVAVVLVWMVNVPSMLAANDLIRALTMTPDPRQNLAAFDDALTRGGFATQEIREQLVAYSAGISTQENIPTELRTAIAEAAVAEMNRQVEELPEDARLRVQLSSAYRTLGDYESAMREIKIAQELSPLKQRLFLEEGIIALQAKDYTAAHDAFSRAYELDTSFDELAMYMAAGEILIGNEQEAKALLLERFGTTTVDNNIVMLAYYERKDFAEVLPVLRARIEADPNEPSNYLQLSSMYTEWNRRADARKTLNDLIAARPDLAAQVMQYIKQVGL
ncbi:MAG TPA: O-antigen ligase family protein [Candidatus Paceibacterota bacterium]|nr:O-antigen ligase family protein [Candidatus Paceibacterota bacterium]